MTENKISLRCRSCRITLEELDIDIVIESTGIFADRKSLEKHIEAGAKKVVLTVPPKDEIDATVVLGVNDGDLNEDLKINI